MNKTFLLIVAIALVSCLNKKPVRPENDSYWQELKDSFAVQNLKTFIVDSALLKTYRSFRPIHNKLIDSVVWYGTPYLYSWQERNSGFTEFTTFVYDREHGSRILYFVFDQSDSLRSVTVVAGKAGEGGVLYETFSVFSANDTMSSIRAATTEWDLKSSEPWLHRFSRSKGDSTFYQLIFSKEGRLEEKKIGEKKELNL